MPENYRAIVVMEVAIEGEVMAPKVTRHEHEENVASIPIEAMEEVTLHIVDPSKDGEATVANEHVIGTSCIKLGIKESYNVPTIAAKVVLIKKLGSIIPIIAIVSGLHVARYAIYIVVEVVIDGS